MPIDRRRYFVCPSILLAKSGIRDFFSTTTAAMCSTLLTTPQNKLRNLEDRLASDAGVIDLRAVAFWCLAKRERLWAEHEVGHFPYRIGDWFQDCDFVLISLVVTQCLLIKHWALECACHCPLSVRHDCCSSVCAFAVVVLAVSSRLSYTTNSVRPLPSSAIRNSEKWSKYPSEIFAPCK